MNGRLEKTGNPRRASHLEVRMCKSTFDVNAVLRTKSEQLLKQVDGEGVRSGEQGREGLLFPEWESADILSGAMRANGVEVVEGWGAKDVEDDRELVVVVAAGEESIDCAGIFLESEHDFGSAVPAGGDVFCGG